ncbi:putative LPS assembly protein LptD [Mucilaginibacter lacusdianchii]|uniref:putative LPS assembly protein LptD n=1 Tax=Mucilaginibacter lacusdianchii TaxID=2684211 RepID=UPI001E2F545A|nr:putative LPS assembly protein LptD [Mucilaginibacter sp. JXJ CY 39]
MSIIARAGKYTYIKPALGRDTIIKLDTVKDKKVLKKNRGSKPSKTPSQTSTNDTTKKKKDGLQSEVKAVADDSTYTDAERNIGYFFGRARVTYEDVEVDADYIRIDQKNHLIFASGRRDPKTGRYTGKPIVKQGSQSPVLADSVYYDYKSKNFKSFNTSTEQDGNFITGGQSRKLNDTEIAYRNILFSTCNLPYPETHFGVVITKGIGEKKRIISGPAYLEIEGVPLPIGVPFGFFPKPESRASGIILPSFGEDATLGFYLRNFGYYIGLSDYMDLTTQGTIYSKGSYELGAITRYQKRYKYQGNLVLNYGSHKYGLEGDPAAKDFKIQWSHSQDANAHPGTTFSASVDAGTATFYQNNPATTGYNPQALTQNNLRSSISYGKTFTVGPSTVNFTASAEHSQDITRKTVTLRLPEFTLNASTFSPFDSPNRLGNQKWYQKLTLGYTLRGTNSLTEIPESELFKSYTLTKRLQNGFQQTVPLSINFNLLKYFNFNAGGTYTETWYFQSKSKRYERGSIRGSADALVTDTVPGFARYGQYTLSSGLSTKVYNTIAFKRGNLRAIRHVMTPSISFSYTPGYGDPSYGYYRTAVSNAVIPYPSTSQRYSIFEAMPFGQPNERTSAGIGFTLDNTIEAKLRAKSTDTTGTDRKVSILQGLTFSTFYNFAADSLKLSPISMNAHTALFNQKVSVSVTGTLDPYVTYARDSISNGQIQRYAQRVNKYFFQAGRAPLLSNLSFSTSFSLNSNSMNSQNRRQVNTLQNLDPNQANRLAMINNDPAAYVDFNIPYNVSVNFVYTYTNTGINPDFSSTLNASGDLNVTPKWKVQYTTGYDLKAKAVSLTRFSVYRDLHCWDLSFSWVPFGLYRSFSVDLKVKASILQDLKLSKRRDYYNNY